MKTAFLAAIIAVSFGISCSRERFFDFRAFYCAGQVERSGADPYLQHPLEECEQSVGAPKSSPVARGVSVPAPFPGFVLALFAGLAALTFPAALFVWVAAAAIALACSALLVARTTRTPLAANAIVLGFPAVVVALPLGQVTPFILLAVAGTAAFLQAGQPRRAALAALGALLDPHVGLALGLAVFVAVPRTRSVLCGGAAAFALLGAAASGPFREWEYLRSVVPAHALANVADAAQFSTTNFAFVAGARPEVALTLGSLWYVGALAAGIVIALRLRARQGVAAVAYVPVAFAVFGGMHTHLQQLALAVPAFMLLIATATGRRREVYATGTFFAAMPWLALALSPWLYLAPAALAVAFADEMGIARQGRRLCAASCLTLCVISQLYVQWHVARTALLHTIPGNPLADVSWQMYTLARNVPPEPWYLVAKAPTEAAFLILFGVLANLALRRPGLVVEC